MSKSRTRFEQVPLEVVKKILEQTESERQAGEEGRDAIFEPAEKSQSLTPFLCSLHEELRTDKK